MGKRKGSKAERWALDHMKGHPTSNSGATFEDGDWICGDRLYEFKSTRKIGGIKLQKNDIKQLRDRAEKLLKTGIFIFVTKDDEPFAVMPKADCVESLLAAFDSPDTKELSSSIARQLHPSLELSMRGESIHVREEDLKNSEGYLRVYRSDDSWCVLPAREWLRVIGDQKE